MKNKDATTPNDDADLLTPEEATVSRIEFETRLLEQEHRLFRVVSSFWQYRKGPIEYRGAASVAVMGLLTRTIFATALFGGFGAVAVLSLVVAIRSNDLLEQQNLKLDQQNLLAEAQRRASLSVDLSSIWSHLRDEVTPNKLSSPFQPSHVLTAEIVALTRALSPYFYLDTDQGIHMGPTQDLNFLNWFVPGVEVNFLPTIEKPLSPGRGQLLVALTSVGADVPHLSLRGATFASSDLRRKILSFPNAEFVDLTDADFSGSILWRTDFTRATLEGARFDCAYFEHVIFGFGGSPYLADGATFRFVNFQEFIVSPLAPEDLSRSTYFIHNAVFQSIDVTDSFLARLTFQGYNSLAEIQLPESFDAERYSIQPNGSDFVVVSNDPLHEATQQDEALDYCAQYQQPDPRLARVIWGGILDDEWTFFGEN